MRTLAVPVVATGLWVVGLGFLVISAGSALALVTAAVIDRSRD